jgi:transposase
MTAHLAEISAMVDPGAHAVVILDQAGWHMSRALAVPQNITLLALPPRSPELNPVENILSRTDREDGHRRKLTFHQPFHRVSRAMS